MPVPRPIIQKLMKATCDKTDLDKKILRLSRSFREVNELLGNSPVTVHAAGKQGRK